MKKLILLAMLLGLTGCGDNKQIDTQSNAQANTLQKAEVAPAVANYSLAATARSMSAVAPLQGWDVLSKSILGSETLINAGKGNFVSSALITPNAKQVAEVIRGGAAGIALTIAVDQLLDAVDWVMDPANNQIKYKVKPCIDCDPQVIPGIGFKPTEYVNYYGGDASNIFLTPIEVCSYSLKYLPIGEGLLSIHKAYAIDHLAKPIPTQIGYRVGCDFTTTIYPNGTSTHVGYVVADSEEKTIPLETVAEQVITNADAGSLDAQVATNIAAQNILNDVVQAEPVVQELENNAKNNCPSGIIKNGSCWKCDKELYYPMSRATRDAKTATRGKSCKDVTDTTIKAANAILFRNLINARVQENACWSPPDPNHATALVDAQNALRLCEN
ncbi:hypothetical protein [Acinetobacter higginsii]|uniref:hypothetical protein n=1 Tax=Acinetobacter higginsii TaxID=70347 RepID=UPI0026755798|nr:hypothetical protein [Acinetobacter higginsii]MDO3663429.1 hypothetical protein [Acinetobacter higginsii]